MSEKLYTQEDLQEHNKPDDCWMVINGKVYDVTKFIDEHPGGEEVILDAAGADATREFEDVGHSEDAVDILKKLYVGEADPASFQVSKKGGSNFNADGSSSSSSSSSLIFVALAAIIAAAAFVYIRVLN